MNNWIAPNQNLLPDFIIGGAMKCGTSTLHSMLSSHPDIFIPKSEIGFFDIDNILQHNDFNTFINNKWVYQSMTNNPEKLWSWYQNKFKNQENKVLGEDSTSYLASPIVAKRLAMQQKEIKLIFLLRQPTLRSYSNYFHLLSTGRATHNFEDTIKYNPYTILERSLYKKQIEAYLKYIPKSRIKFIVFEDFIQNPKNTLQEVCTFLNISFDKFPAETENIHTNKAKLPISMYWQIKKNYLMRNFGNTIYANELPNTFPNKKGIASVLPYFNKVFNAIIINSNKKPPKINTNTKAFLDQYFIRELQGINELVEQDVLSKWFTNHSNLKNF